MENTSQDWGTWTTPELLAHRDQLFATLPRTPQGVRGSVVFKVTRCGKASCHCAYDGTGHARHYLSSTIDGRTHLDYIPPDWLAWVRDQVAYYRQWQHTMRQLTDINRELFRRRIRDGTETRKETP